MCGLERHQRGMSLIEMMVGIVVALLVVAAAIGSSAYMAGRQRAAVDVGSAAGNETSALAALKHEVAQAGLGFFADGRLLCRTMNLSQGTTAIATGTALMPLQLGADAGGMTLDVLHGSALESVSPVAPAAPVTGADASLAIANFLPLAADQTLLLAPGPTSIAPCTVRTATAVTPAVGTTPQTIAMAANGAANQVAFADARYDTTDLVSQLGQLDWARFHLQGDQLLMDRPLAAATGVVVARNVVAFAAEYGTADTGAGSTSIAAWRAPTGAWAALGADQLLTLRALRIGLVLRSAQPEKKDATGRCTATSSAPVLFGPTPLTLADPDWACYRYRVGVVVVPLRNIVMGNGT